MKGSVAVVSTLFMPLSVRITMRLISAVFGCTQLSRLRRSLRLHLVGLHLQCSFLNYSGVRVFVSCC